MTTHALLDTQQTLAQLVLDHSEYAEVFQRHHIDFCCRGEATLAVAAVAKGLDVAALVEELSRATAERSGSPEVDPRALSTLQLVAHVVSTHHQYLRKALPFILGLATKVSRVHGERNPKLRALAAAVGQLAQQLIPHLDEEERVLFPALVSQEPGPVVIPLLESMLEEHRAVAQLLEQIRAASDDFALPEWGCNSYRTLFAELKRLESDTFTHVHLENHVLMPRFSPSHGAGPRPAPQA
jgi:regulator of cell morphogenesis and NO signaling